MVRLYSPRSVESQPHSPISAKPAARAYDLEGEASFGYEADEEAQCSGRRFCIGFGLIVGFRHSANSPDSIPHGAEAAVENL
ncbi:hypothetical protein VTH06DRAFT_2882 [Thermothelomyces fergusii]